MNSHISRIGRLVLIIFALWWSFNSPTWGQIPATGLVATPDSHATSVAHEILGHGGNAVDAAVAAMYALAVVQPYSAGPGAGGFMLIWLEKEKKSIVIDFRERSPQSVAPAIFYQDSLTFKIYTEYGYQSICVPGMVAGAEKALHFFGTMSASQVLQPAIALASNGFTISEALANITTEYYRVIESNRATSELFFPDWFPIAKGQKQIRSELAQTLNLISHQGAKVFYQGEIAQEIAEELNRNNGLLQLNDLTTYEPKLRPAAQGKYRNLEIISTPPPSSGGFALIELLKMLEQIDIRKYSLNSGSYIHMFVEAMKQMFEDRESYYLGDPEFDRLNAELVLSDHHIQDCISQLDTSSASVVLNPIASKNDHESSNGCHISILDKYGNAVAVSMTLNGFFGSAVTISKYGILLNNAMSNFSAQPDENNSIGPGKRPQSSLAPTIILKNQKPYLILGGNGAERIISMMAQLIINIVDFGLSLNEAIRAPRFHYNYYDDRIEMEMRIDAEAIEYLKKLGHKVHLRSDFDEYFGSAEAILFDPVSQKTAAIKDVREKGVVYIQ